jgi:SAM-dependent methyltransferase
MDVISVYIGERLGLYRALADAGPSTPPSLAERASINPRYAREWLEQQAVTGILSVDDASRPADQRRYSLPAEHAEALLNFESPFSMSPLARLVVSVTQALPKVIQAYRTGGGVNWSDYGPDAIEAQGDFNRPWLIAEFGAEYLPAIPDIHQRLQSDPPALVADIACGVGWSSIAVAKAYAKASVHGFDLDESSIKIANDYARQHGLSDRVKFQVSDVSGDSFQGKYDLAVMVEALHDMSRPIEALTNVRRILKPGGSLIVVDERVHVRLQHHLLPPHRHGGATLRRHRTVLRPDTLRDYASRAGFKNVEVLENIQHPFFRFYRLTP